MRQIELNTDNGVSKILIGESIENISKYFAENTVIISDKNVMKFYKSFFSNNRIIEIEPGERSKSFDVIDNIVGRLLELNVDRSTFLLGVGGGVVTDISGFVASIFNRGLKFGYVSTTLLGQVDASIGGKNGINYNKIKNVIGTINQPEFVICDLNCLETLPRIEIKNGIAEIIKIALIADTQLFELIERNYDKIINLERDVIEEVIYRSASIKAKIVKEDVRENGIRRILNFGHTIGHAIETISGLSHGESISIGMVKAIELSIEKLELGFDILVRVKDLLRLIGLPIAYEYEKEKIFKAIVHDKKRYAQSLNFVVLNKIGEAEIIDLEVDELMRYL